MVGGVAVGERSSTYNLAPRTSNHFSAPFRRRAKGTHSGARNKGVGLYLLVLYYLIFFWASFIAMLTTCARSDDPGLPHYNILVGMESRKSWGT